MSKLSTLDTVPYHPIMEEVVNTLCTQTQNKDPRFFRMIVAYFFGKMAASMRARITTPISLDDIPVNVYSVALATSGFGKGYSVSIMENKFLGGFANRFKKDTFPLIADTNMWRRAIETAANNGTEEEEERNKLEAQYKRAGAVPFTFDSGTPAAIKQIREKLLLSEIGAINLQIDEIGSNLIASTDILNVFLELYDQGQLKQKLIKNTAENERAEDLDGKTPANALLFGTPSKLMDGAQTQKAFFDFLETGYARRALFGWGESDRSKIRLSAQERFNRLTQQAKSKSAQQLATHFTLLADPAKFGWQMTMADDVALTLLEYQNQCEHLADQMSEHEDIRKAEMQHRHSKAVKLAGALAFVDESIEITSDHLLQAIKLVEESGETFQKLLNPEEPYVKLARFLAEVPDKKTVAELMTLPYYKAATSQMRQEMVRHAASWGYKNHVIIRKTFEDGIEFYEGETLKETDLNKMILSYSDDFAHNYVTEPAPFDKLPNLLQAKDLHWANHRFQKGHRSEEHTIPGFNMVTVDVDGGVTLDFVHDAFKDHMFITHTTKRHTDEEHRFRLIFPLVYQLEMSKDDYDEFMANLLMWLPFDSDKTARQRSKKWMTTENALCKVNQGKLLDPLPFIPKTSRNEEYHKGMQELGSLDNLERWFAQRISVGDRNNQMIKYALALVDSGMSFLEVERAVISFNQRINNGLSESELRSSILVTVAKRYSAAA